MIKVTQAGPRTQTSGYRGLPHSAPPGQGAVSPAALPQCRTEQAIHTHSVTRGLTSCLLLSPKPAQFTSLGYKHLESREVRKSRYKIMLRVRRGCRWMLGLGGLCHEAAGRQPAPPAHNVVTSNVLSKAQGGTSRPQPKPEASPTWPSASTHALLQVGLWSKLR